MAEEKKTFKSTKVASGHENCGAPQSPLSTLATTTKSDVVPCCSDNMENGSLQQDVAAKNLEFMVKGCRLVKVRSGKKFERYFQVDQDHVSMGYVDTEKIMWLRRIFRKTEDQSKVFITEIQEVREGVQNSDEFAKHFEKLGVTEDQCFSLIVGGKHKALDLVARSPDARDIWVRGLRHLLKKLSQTDIRTQQEMWMKQLFRTADKNGDLALNFKEIMTLINNMNVDIDEETAQELFNEADTEATQSLKGRSVLNPEEFVDFYKNITKRPEIEEIFAEYNYEGDYLEPEELRDFLQKENKISLSVEECADLIVKFEQCPDCKEQKKMSIDGFRALLNSSLAELFNPEHSKVYQDMSQPLSHYFIDSSHNTYLMADQLVGPSAVEAYIRALKMGCRCVELDCWDGDNGDPVIYHGHTLTSKISFKDVITAVNTYAFEASEYPVILSIENHCGVEQQKVMAHYMTSILGDKLYTDPIDENLEELQSPEFFKGRILVKGKKIPPSKFQGGDDVDGEVSDEDEAAEMETEETQKVKKTKDIEANLKLAKDLSDTVVLFRSVHFSDFATARSKYKCFHISSFGESKAFKLAEEEPEEYIKHNKWQISRIYPGGLRTDSSNYDPWVMWACGCQIVALNYQTGDQPMIVNQGRFLDNAGCGYVLKPEVLRSTKKGEKMFSPKGAFPDSWKKSLKLTVISGYQLPKVRAATKANILDPYVIVSIVGVPADCKEGKTAWIHNNGFRPRWDHVFEFDVTMPELAVVSFVIKDYQARTTEEVVGQYSLPFLSMQQGYRMINLLTKNGSPIWGSTIFVKVEIS